MQNDNVVTDNPTYSFTATAAGTYVANFTLNSYTVTATAEPDEGGFIEGAGTYNYGETCTLTATANEGYSFDHWSYSSSLNYDYEAEYFTIESLADGNTITFTNKSTATGGTTVYWSKDKVNWTASNSAETSVSTDNGEKVYWKAVMQSGKGWTADEDWLEYNEKNSRFLAMGPYKVSGNIMSMLYGDNFYGQYSLESFGGHVFHGFFRNSSDGGNLNLVDAADLVLPATTLVEAAYGMMFSSCSNLIHGPKELPATYAPPGAYWAMFDHCTNLVESPVIRATSMGTEVCPWMFRYCSSLTKITCLLTSYQSYWQLYQWVDGVPSGGTFYKAPAMTGWPTGINGIPSGWTVASYEDSTPSSNNGFNNDPSITFTVTEDIDIIAYFTPNTYEVTATAEPEEGGFIEGAGTYAYGEECTLTAIANDRFTFVNWTEDGEEVSTDTEYTFTVTGDRVLVANFEEVDYYWTPVTGMSGSMTILGILKIDDVETYEDYYEIGAFCGTECRGSARPVLIEGYNVYSLNIVGDTDGEVITFRLYDHELGEELDLRCADELVFEDGMSYGSDEFYEFNFYSMVEITVMLDPEEGGTVDGAGFYSYYETCTLTATANEGYQFNSWMVDGETVSTETTYSFTVEGPVDVMALFDMAQTVELSQGWSWWSTNVEMSGIDGLGMLESNLNPFGRVIKSSDKFVQYQTALHRWIGSLDALANEEGYKVQATQACTVTMVGSKADPYDHPITIHPNWTWIGYPVSHPQTVETALSGFEPSVNDIIKSQSSSARYLPSVGWIPATFTLTPGESYMYYSKAAGDKTLVYTDGRGETATMDDGRHWRNDVHAFADNLCLLAVVEIDGTEQRSEELELGAFVNGECRGSAKLMYIEPLDRYYAMMTVMGEDGDEIEFAVIDAQGDWTSYQSSTRLTFASDAIVGEFDDPYVVSFGSTTSSSEYALHMGLYPNPVNRSEAFNILVPEDETVTEWTVVNALGAVVRRETGALTGASVEGLATSGVYLVKVTCKSGRVYLNRLVVK